MRSTKSRPQRRASGDATRDLTVMQEIEKEQKAREKNTARLRALRLAKEADDKERSERIKAEKLVAIERAVNPSGKKSARSQQRSEVDIVDSKDGPKQRG